MCHLALGLCAMALTVGVSGTGQRSKIKGWDGLVLYPKWAG